MYSGSLRYKHMELSRNVFRYGIGYFWHSATLFSTVSLFCFFGQPAPAPDNYPATRYLVCRRVFFAPPDIFLRSIEE